MNLLINKRLTRQSDTSRCRAHQGALISDGPLPILGDREQPRLRGAPPPAGGLIDEDQVLVHCQRCDADHPASAVWTLSTHPTSQGVVTYFRCPAGHADFYTTGR